MPWQEITSMTARKEFIVRAHQDGANISALCRQYGISRKTGYTWLRRHAQDTDAGTEDRSRTPHHQPRPSTITAILQRHGLIAPRQRYPPATRRFTHAAPHDLWQMDFMGPRPLATDERVHPLTILDDHSRVLRSLTACPQQRLDLVWSHVTACFTLYGLPRAMLTDNGPPWGPGAERGITRFEVWLLQLGIELWHGRVAHPQTQGKVERIHRTINEDVFGTRTFRDLSAAQRAFDEFQSIYNLERPHEELAYAVPMSRMQPSPRILPAVVPPPAYAPEDIVRRVRGQGAISFANRRWFLGRGLIGEDVVIRPTTQEGVSTVHYYHKQVSILDLNDDRKV